MILLKVDIPFVVRIDSFFFRKKEYEFWNMYDIYWL